MCPGERVGVFYVDGGGVVAVAVMRDRSRMRSRFRSRILVTWGFAVSLMEQKLWGQRLGARRHGGGLRPVVVVGHVSGSQGHRGGHMSLQALG